MHVVLLGPVAPPAGGVQSHVAALRERIRAAGMRASLVAVTRSEPTNEPDTYYPRSAIDLLRIVRRLHPDVVHVHLGGDLTRRLAALCAVLTVMPRMRVVLTFHSGGFPDSAKGRAANRWTPEGAAMRRLDAIIAVNPAIARVFAAYGVPPERLHTIAPHARVDPSRLAPTLPPELRAFFDRHHPVFVSVGLLEPEYSLDLQIEALPQLRTHWPGAGLVMIGSGSLHERLRQLIDASPARADIMLTGNLDHRYALRAIEQADVLLRTTVYDGDAVSVREALQLGTAVVASNTGMRPDGVVLMSGLTRDAVVDAARTALGPEARATGSGGSSDSDQLHEVLALYHRLTS